MYIYIYIYIYATSLTSFQTWYQLLVKVYASEILCLRLKCFSSALNNKVPNVVPQVLV